MSDSPETPSLINQNVTPEPTDPGAEPAPAVDATQAPPEPAPEPAAPEFEPLTAEQFTLPESIDSEGLAPFLEVVNEAKLPAEQGQKFLEMFHEQVSAMAESQARAWNETQETWLNEVKSDPEIGGDKLSAALGEIAKVVDRYGSKELREFMDVSGAGNNPHVVKFLHGIAKAVNERPPVSGQPSATSAQSRAERMFRNQGAS